MKELEVIQNQIDLYRQRRIEIRSDLKELKSNLEIKKKKQGAAIAEKNNADDLGKEIVALQTQISGVEEAGKQLIESLRDLESRKAILNRALANERAEASQSEILKIEMEIVRLLVCAAELLPKLHNVRVEYVAHLVSAESVNAKLEGNKITSLLEKLRSEIPNLLDRFPPSVFANGNFPTPSALRAAIKRS